MEAPGRGVWGQGWFPVLRTCRGRGETRLLTCHLARTKADTNPAAFYTRALLPAPYVVDLILVTETGLAFPLVPLLCWSPLLSFGLWWLTSFWFILHCGSRGRVGLVSSLPISHAPFESELVSDISHVRIGTYDSASFEFKALPSPFPAGCLWIIR